MSKYELMLGLTTSKNLLLCILGILVINNLHLYTILYLFWVGYCVIKHWLEVIKIENK